MFAVAVLVLMIVTGGLEVDDVVLEADDDLGADDHLELHVVRIDCFKDKKLAKAF